MNNIIKEYVKNLNEEDIKKLAKKNNIDVTDEEVKIIYLYIKNYWPIFYSGDAKELFIELKEKLREETYHKLVNMYKEFKKYYQ